MSSSLLQDAYRHMYTSRAIDLVSKEYLAGGGLVPNYHSGIGQEAMSVAMGMAALPDDYALYTYRDFGLLLAKGVPLSGLVGDLLLTVSGTTRGHGGIMHVSDPERGVPGRNSIFGSRFGIAIGLAKALVLSKTRGVVWCPYGEAEGSRGTFYEALNFAGLFKLPVVFVAENNGFAISARTEDLYYAKTINGMFLGAGIPTVSIDGNDFEASHSALAAARAFSAAGHGPFLVECMTYRLDPHIPLDDEAYRTSEEIADRRRSDPLPVLRQELLATSISNEADIEEMERQAVSSVRIEFDKAAAAGRAPLDDLAQSVYYTDGPWATRGGA